MSIQDKKSYDMKDFYKVLELGPNNKSSLVKNQQRAASVAFSQTRQKFLKNNNFVELKESL